MAGDPQLWLGDASAAARVLCAIPDHRRPWVLERMLREAYRAHLHSARTGRAHRLWGDGSLMAAALRRRPMGEPPLSHRGFCQCLAGVLLRLNTDRGFMVEYRPYLL